MKLNTTSLCACVMGGLLLAPQAFAQDLPLNKNVGFDTVLSARRGGPTQAKTAVMRGRPDVAPFFSPGGNGPNKLNGVAFNNRSNREMALAIGTGELVDRYKGIKVTRIWRGEVATGGIMTFVHWRGVRADKAQAVDGTNDSLPTDTHQDTATGDVIAPFTIVKLPALPANERIVFVLDAREAPAKINERGPALSMREVEARLERNRDEANQDSPISYDWREMEEEAEPDDFDPPVVTTRLLESFEYTLSSGFIGRSTSYKVQLTGQDKTALGKARYSMTITVSGPTVKIKPITGALTDQEKQNLVDHVLASSPLERIDAFVVPLGPLPTDIPSESFRIDFLGSEPHLTRVARAHHYTTADGTDYSTEIRETKRLLFEIKERLEALAASGGGEGEGLTGPVFEAEPHDFASPELPASGPLPFDVVLSKRRGGATEAKSTVMRTLSDVGPFFSPGGEGFPGVMRTGVNWNGFGQNRKEMALGITLGQITDHVKALSITKILRSPSHDTGLNSPSRTTVFFVATPAETAVAVDGTDDSLPTDTHQDTTLGASLGAPITPYVIVKLPALPENEIIEFALDGIGAPTTTTATGTTTGGLGAALQRLNQAKD